MRSQRQRKRSRRGTTAVETAVILPVFLTFLFGLFEYGRMVMIDNALDNACRQAARYGSTEGVSTEMVDERVKAMLGSAFDVELEGFAVVVKDASVFDSGGDLPLDSEDINNMSNLELSGAESRQMFCVHSSVPYNDVALIPWSFTKGVVLTGTSYTRHE